MNKGSSNQKASSIQVTGRIIVSLEDKGDLLDLLCERHGDPRVESLTQTLFGRDAKTTRMAAKRTVEGILEKIRLPL